MANQFIEKRRNVIPGWRGFRETASIGELGGFARLEFGDDTNEPTKLIRDWRKRSTIGLAADIISTSVHFNIDKSVVEEARALLLAESDQLPEYLVELALGERQRGVLDKPSGGDIFSIAGHRVRKIRAGLRNNPGNGIRWCELALEYAILGVPEKAMRAMTNALHLAKENRYVLRSAARLFLHAGDEEQGHDLLRKSVLVKHDPWVMASEIAVATLRNRQSRFTKAGIQLANRKTFSPQNLGELTTALGTLEWMHGSRKNAKRFLSQSVDGANDNSLAQIQWISQKDSSVHFELIDRKAIQGFHETLAKEDYIEERFERAMTHAVSWHNDSPFAERPVLMGTHIATVFLKDYALSMSLAREGLRSNPNTPGLWNNLAYAAALADQLEEATSAIRRGQIWATTPIDRACLEATSGLVAYRNGDATLARHQYGRAIEIAEQEKDEGLRDLARVNMLREEAKLKLLHHASEEFRWLEEQSKSKNIAIRKISNDTLKLLLPS